MTDLTNKYINIFIHSQVSINYLKYISDILLAQHKSNGVNSTKIINYRDNIKLTYVLNLLENISASMYMKFTNSNNFNPTRLYYINKAIYNTTAKILKENRNIHTIDTIEEFFILTDYMSKNIFKQYNKNDFSEVYENNHELEQTFIILKKLVLICTKIQNEVNKDLKAEYISSFFRLLQNKNINNRNTKNINNLLNK